VRKVKLRVFLDLSGLFHCNKIFVEIFFYMPIRHKVLGSSSKPSVPLLSRSSSPANRRGWGNRVLAPLQCLVALRRSMRTEDESRGSSLEKAHD